MKYAVAVKQVPGTADISVDSGGNLIRSAGTSVLDLYCEYALRRILAVRSPEDEVTVFTMGPGHASEALRRCLCLGADKAFLISDASFAGSDTWATSLVLSEFIRRFIPDADLIVFGRTASDGGTGQVPSETAGLLSVQQFCYVDELSVEDGKITVTQDYGAFVRSCRVPAGSVIAFAGTDPCGTLMSISDRISGMRKPLTKIGREDLGIPPGSAGIKGSKTAVIGTHAVEIRRKSDGASLKGRDIHIGVRT